MNEPLYYFSKVTCRKCGLDSTISGAVPEAVGMHRLEMAVRLQFKQEIDSKPRQPIDECPLCAPPGFTIGGVSVSAVPANP